MKKRIEVNESCGNKILERIRLQKVLPNVKGKVLDIGCGCNNLVLNYRRIYNGEGIGVDVFTWPNADLIVKNSSKLPFKPKSFDTVTLIACLNHIPYREAVLKEAHRLLKPKGTLLITMIPSHIGELWHKFPEKLWGERKKGRKFEEDEKGGLDNDEVLKLIKQAGFKSTRIEKFSLGLNNLFISKKAK